MCHKIIFTLTHGFTHWGRVGEGLSAMHTIHVKPHMYNLIHSGALQKFINILETSMYK